MRQQVQSFNLAALQPVSFTFFLKRACVYARPRLVGSAQSFPLAFDIPFANAFGLWEAQLTGTPSRLLGLELRIRVRVKRGQSLWGWQSWQSLSAAAPWGRRTAAALLFSLECCAACSVSTITRVTENTGEIRAKLELWAWSKCRWGGFFLCISQPWSCCNFQCDCKDLHKISIDSNIRSPIWPENRFSFFNISRQEPIPVSANLVMTHRDKAKYSCVHLPQQTEGVNTATWLHIVEGEWGWVWCGSHEEGSPTC